MRRWIRPLTVLGVAVVLGAGATGANAASSAVNQILNECSSGQIAGHFTVAQLHQALRQLPTSANEYSSCADVINRAILAAQHHRSGGSGSGGGGSFLPIPVIVVLAVLIVAALVFGGLALRNRGAGGPGRGGEPARRGETPP